MTLRPMLGCALLIAFACGGGAGAKMTRQEIETNGRRVFNADGNTVFRASVDALKSLGFGIAVQRPDKGLIKSEHRIIRTDTRARSSSRYTARAQTTAYRRQWVIRIEKKADRTIQVTAEPKIYKGDIDISDKPVWALKAERKLWNELFEEIELLL